MYKNNRGRKDNMLLIPWIKQCKDEQYIWLGKVPECVTTVQGWNCVTTGDSDAPPGDARRRRRQRPGRPPEEPTRGRAGITRPSQHAWEGGELSPGLDGRNEGMHGAQRVSARGAPPKNGSCGRLVRSRIRCCCGGWRGVRRLRRHQSSPFQFLSQKFSKPCFLPNPGITDHAMVRPRLFL